MGDDIEGRIAAAAQAVRESEVTGQRLDELDGAPARLAAAIDAMERHVHESGDPRRGQLRRLAEERGRLEGECRELGEARDAAQAARSALAAVHDRLRRAADWSAYDTFCRTA